jgi:hypothetical protein
MKILDVPQTGKLGLTVTFPRGNCLVRRAVFAFTELATTA